VLLDSLEETTEYLYEPNNRSVKLHRKLSYGQLVLEDEFLAPQPGPEVAEVLSGHLTADDLGDDFHTLTRRLELVLTYRPEAAEDLKHTLGKVPEPGSVRSLLLKSYLRTVTRWSRKAPQELQAYSLGLLGYDLLQKLDSHLPPSVNLPGRRRPVPISYPDHGEPFLRSKLQDFFGWTPPKFMNGEIDLVCHLLAPNGRACQITTDLESFWSGSYAQVRKDLRGRYPKHDWPEKVE
jgi:ATP-dependent helicase HrpB